MVPTTRQGPTPDFKRSRKWCIMFVSSSTLEILIIKQRQRMVPLQSAFTVEGAAANLGAETERPLRILRITGEFVMPWQFLPCFS